MELFSHLTKAFNYKPTLSANELSQNIAEAAFNTSSLLAEMGQHYTNDPNYRNVYVTHPTVAEVAEGAVIPDSTVQTYSTTEADYKKIASRIQLTNEVMEFANYDVEANTAQLLGNVVSNKIATDAIANFATRHNSDPDNAPEPREAIRELKSGVNGAWGADVDAIYNNLAELVKTISDVYDSNSKLYLNKSNFVDFVTLVNAQTEQVWVVQNGLFLGRYEMVIVDQLPDDVIYFGDMEAAFDVISFSGNQTVNPFTNPSLLEITNTNKYGFISKDSRAITALVQGV